MRFRHLFLIGGSTASAGALLLTDPDGGIVTALLGMSLVSNLLAVLLAHWSRKALHDYPEADARGLFRMARTSPTGAGLALLALAVVLNGLLGLFGKAMAAVPDQALPLLPLLQAEQRAHWPDHPMPHYFGGLIDHESACPRPRSCWKPTAQLKSAREEGAGLGQLTRAYHPDGRLRFDALREMREAHPALRELDWASIYQRPDLQLRAVVLKSRGDWLVMPDAPARLHFTDLAYNAGRGRVTQDRRACQIKPGCDPHQWAGHVELTCTASRKPIYGTRSACDISRHHVHDVIEVRAPRYAGLL
jgi:hypothetical protein